MKQVAVVIIGCNEGRRLRLCIDSVLREWVPLEIAAFVALLLIFRSAWEARAKSSSTVTLLLYGLHSHLQQLPIYLGRRNFQQR